MKIFVLVAALVTSFSAFAAGDSQPEFVQTCAQKGLEKLRAQADGEGVTLQEETFDVCGVDDRWYNPSKYVWYCANATAQDGSGVKIQKLVQWHSGKCH